MTSKQLVVVANDPFRFGPIQEGLAEVDGLELIQAEATDEAACLLGNESVAMVVVTQRNGEAPIRLLGLIAGCSSRAVPVPIVVVTDCYDEAEATTFFRLGVADYLSLADHVNQIRSVVQTILGLKPQVACKPRRERSLLSSLTPRISIISPVA
jgi:DNA-binding NarL/FixJ family response regulator